LAHRTRRELVGGHAGPLLAIRMPMTTTRSRAAPSRASGRALTPVLLPTAPRDIVQTAARCRKLVTRRALISASAAVVPVPGLDLAVDIPLLMSLLDDINTEFGLTPEQIDQLAPRRRVSVHRAIAGLGSSAIGRAVSREIIATIFKKLAQRIATKQVAKFVPFAGQAVAASISFSAVKLIGHAHIADCVAVAEQVAGEAR
jgi:uncharacterized protein (DUF697 family)